MAAIGFKRIAIFSHTDSFRIFGVSAKRDYYNLICTLTVFKGVIGFEYVWKNSKHELKKAVLIGACHDPHHHRSTGWGVLL